MATPAVIPFPSPFPAAINTVITQVHGNRTFPAASGAVVRTATPRQFWQVEFDTELATLAESALLMAFLAELEGTLNVFDLPVPRYRNTDFPGSGYSVQGAGQTGSSLLVQGFAANVALPLVGKFLTVNSELKVVLNAPVTSSGGAATLQVWPTLRRSPSNFALVELERPTLRAMRVNGDGVSVANRGHYRTKFVCVEDVTYAA